MAVKSVRTRREKERREKKKKEKKEKNSFYSQKDTARPHFLGRNDSGRVSRGRAERSETRSCAPLPISAGRA